MVKLNEDKINEIKREFISYKNSKKLTTKIIGKKLEISASCIGIYFNKFFGKEYKELAKRRSSWLTKLEPEDIKNAFEKYKSGMLISEIETEVNVKRGVLLPRFRKIIGKEYIKLAKIRKYIDAGRARKRRIPNDIIKDLFEIYKKELISIEKLAKTIGIKESSLIDRFERIFGKEYEIIAYSRRDERKVSEKKYILAFEKYKNTKISLTELSEELGIKISSLAPRFRKMFGDEYTNIAREKQDLIEIDRKGRLAEELAMEYLLLMGFGILDLERKLVADNLKRPDIVLNNMFIEIKNNYVTLEGFGNVKGYKKILDDYLNRNIKRSNVILEKGMIISFSGFSPIVRNKALSDDIKLIGPKEIKEVFIINNRDDLIEKFNSLRGSSNFTTL